MKHALIQHPGKVKPKNPYHDKHFLKESPIFLFRGKVELQVK